MREKHDIIRVQCERRDMTSRSKNSRYIRKDAHGSGICLSLARHTGSITLVVEGTNAMNIYHNTNCFNIRECIINEYVNKCPERIGRHLFCDTHRQTKRFLNSGSNPGSGRWHNVRINSPTKLDSTVHKIRGYTNR